MYKLLVLVLLFVSCSKEKEELNLIGDWVLIDGYVYVDNLETGYKHKYSHFSIDKTQSSITAFKPLSYIIEDISKDSTVWSFYTDNTFIINYDLHSKLYFESYGEGEFIIYEHPTTTRQVIGGSSKYFNAYTYDYDRNIIVIELQEQYGSYNGYNCKWKNELFFEKIN